MRRVREVEKGCREGEREGEREGKRGSVPLGKEGGGLHQHILRSSRNLFSGTMEQWALASE